MSDLAELPGRILLDTGVLLRALGHKPSDPRARACESVLRYALEHDRRVLLAAPSIAEVERGTPESGATIMPIPKSRSLAVVPFDRLAAEMIGRRMPMVRIQQFKASDGYFLDYLKYDALIVGTALRWGAECVVTLDGGMCDRYNELIPVRMATEFVDTQPNLL